MASSLGHAIQGHQLLTSSATRNGGSPMRNLLMGLRLDMSTSRQQGSYDSQSSYLNPGSHVGSVGQDVCSEPNSKDRRNNPSALLN